MWVVNPNTNRIKKVPKERKKKKRRKNAMLALGITLELIPICAVQYSYFYW